jgi:hypothetical protein
VSIVFYISGHGFGHASRDVEIINRLPPGRSPVIIRSAVSPDLLARTISVPYTLRAGICDTGIVQTSSITHDDAATVAAAAAFYPDLAARAEREAAALAGDHVTLVLGDIPPLAFEVAARLSVPSLALGNFTWDWIYETHPGFAAGAGWTLDVMRAAYRKATLALELPFGTGFDVFPHVKSIPLVARRPTQSRRATRAHFGLPAGGRVALLSFGGYGLPSVDLASVDCRDEWTVVTTDRVTSGTSAVPAHVRVVVEGQFLTSAFRYEDLVAAVDVVMTKPGYGILGECVAAGTSIVYTSRGAFREYDVLVGAMSRVVRSVFISQADLLAGRWRAALEGALAQADPPETLQTNGADVAAEIIESLLT